MPTSPPGLPEPITTQADGGFVSETMSERQPENIRRVIEAYPDAPPGVLAALERLHDDLKSGAPIRWLTDVTLPDRDAWRAAYDAQAAKFEPLTWRNCGWFFAETFLFRHLCEAADWFETRRDPFGPIKAEELDSERPWELLETVLQRKGDPVERIVAHAEDALWGNRIDLSYAAAASHGTQVHDEDLIVNHREGLADLLAGLDGGTVHLVADNAGSELMMDFVLIDALLAGGFAVQLHLKWHPTFVSDAIAPDVWGTLDHMAKHGGGAADLGGRLRSTLAERRLTLAPHPYWTSPRFLWEADPPLLSELNSGVLVILKGDANYRRAIGDALWPVDAAFGEVLRASVSTPVLALRTMKSPPALGMTAAQAAALDAEDPAWRVNGKRGVIQLSI